jgi:hypothetical protein
MAIKKLSRSRHSSHSYVRNSNLGFAGSISANFITLLHFKQDSSVVSNRVQVGVGRVVILLLPWQIEPVLAKLRRPLGEVSPAPIDLLGYRGDINDRADCFSGNFAGVLLAFRTSGHQDSLQGKRANF